MAATIPFILTISYFFLNTIVITSDGAPISLDSTNLLKFRDSINDDNAMLANWSFFTPPCFGERSNWIGIICSQAGSIWGLKLDNMRLSGSINVEHLVELSRLRSLSFINNSFDGTMPDFRRLGNLQSVFLSNNNFEGIIDPNVFDGMKRLRKIHLSFNKFGGEIPKSLSKLEKLEELRLEGNKFEGVIPDIKTDSMQIFNVSSNQLHGQIPSSLAKFDSSAFSGNKELCGFPSANNCSPQSSNNQNISASSSSGGAPPTAQSTSEKPIPIVAILSGVVVIMVLAILIALIIRNNNSEQNQKDKGGPCRRNVGSFKRGSDRETVSRDVRNKNKANTDNEKMTFLDMNRSNKFDLPDLLKAGAEILGSGCFGSSYKATLSNGNVVVVKRFKKMNNVSREEFHDHMRKLGMLSHPNLLPLVAYYYRKEEKLFITDVFQNGSLGNLLHGRQVKGKTILDWPTRLKVIKGVTKGLLELYKGLPNLIAPHGHLKSSNVLLNKEFDPILSDYALIPLINQECAQSLMIAYKSPEYFNHSRITKKTDVWSLGILILETLTGKFPAGFLHQGKDVDMSTWVESISHGGFDKNLLSQGQSKSNCCEVEMQKLLSIALACCEVNVEKRLDIKQAYEMIEQVKESDNNNSNNNSNNNNNNSIDDDYYSTRASTEIDFRSVRGTSDEITLAID